MAEEPHTNSAGGKAFNYWLYNRRKGAEAWIKVAIIKSWQFMATFMGKTWEKHDELCDFVFVFGCFWDKPMIIMGDIRASVRFGRWCIFFYPKCHQSHHQY